MADEADNAQLVTDAALEDSVRRITARAAEKKPSLGYCQSPVCGNDFDAGDNRLFCDGKCADDAARYGV